MTRLQRLEQRRLDESVIVKASMANEAYRQMNQTESVRYTIGAMLPIDPEYTKNTYAQGDRVKNQLQQRLTQACDFEYQGSTTTDTHIKARSDIDLLMIYTAWYWIEPPQVNTSPYKGVPADDIKKLRADASDALKSAFPQAEHNSGGARAIKISGASLSREVDVVPASWLDTNEYTRTGDKLFRGVKIFDAKKNEFKSNTPFLHQRRIELRDQETRGGYRKAVRLMKTLRYDSEGRSDISSYDICGIAYGIAPHNLTVQRPRELAILEACHEYCQRLLVDTNERNAILVPDGHRTVFGGEDGTTLTQLTALANEISGLRSDILRENVRSIARLVEAHVEYPSTSPTFR